MGHHCMSVGVLLWAACVSSAHRDVARLLSGFLQPPADSHSAGPGQNSLHLKAVYINADKAVTRNKHMVEMLKGANLSADRFTAFDYSALNDSDILNTLGYPRDALHLDKRIKDRNVEEKAFGLHITDGTLGCYLSHVAVLRKLNESLLPHELGLVMEDDVQLVQNWSAKLQLLLEVVPEDWCVLKVNGWGPQHLRQEDRVVANNHSGRSSEKETATDASIDGTKEKNMSQGSWDIYRTSAPFYEAAGFFGGESFFYPSSAGYMVRKAKLPALLQQLMQPNITDFDEALLSTDSCVTYEALPHVVELAPLEAEQSTFHSTPVFYTMVSKLPASPRKWVASIWIAISNISNFFSSMFSKPQAENKAA